VREESGHYFNMQIVKIEIRNRTPLLFCHEDEEQA
jgi:hypothetical protein